MFRRGDWASKFFLSETSSFWKSYKIFINILSVPHLKVTVHSPLHILSPLRPMQRFLKLMVERLVLNSRLKVRLNVFLGTITDISKLISYLSSPCLFTLLIVCFITRTILFKPFSRFRTLVRGHLECTYSRSGIVHFLSSFCIYWNYFTGNYRSQRNCDRRGPLPLLLPHLDWNMLLLILELQALRKMHFKGRGCSFYFNHGR